MKRLLRPTIIAVICFSLLPIENLSAALTLTVNVSTVSIPFLTTDYNSSTGAAQVIKTTAQTLSIRSTSSTWTLSVRALTSTFSFMPSLGDANPNKPAGDLAVRTPITSSTWLVLTTTDQVLSTGPRTSGTETITRDLDYRLDSNLSTDPPGTYTISLIYTLTVP